MVVSVFVPIRKDTLTISLRSRWTIVAPERIRGRIERIYRTFPIGFANWLRF